MTTVQTHELLNTLFIQSQGAYLHVDHETLKVEMDGRTALQVPVHHLGAIVCIGNILVSPGAIHQCAEDGRNLVFLDINGRFKARLEGPTSGNVLLRIAQYKAHFDTSQTASIAKAMAAGKVQNARQVLLRAARLREDAAAEQGLRAAAQVHESVIQRLEQETDLERIRGLEGEAAVAYFSVFQHLILGDTETFKFSGRNRRPPLDPMNALLSFIYALLLTDCLASAQGVGLDPQIGFLHALRPGRPALALDLIEEFRPVVADRLALTLVNRQQLGKEHFEQHTGGAVSLNEQGRKITIVEYQKKQQEEVTHPVLDRPVPIGLIPHIQARLLARKLRGDTEEYTPFLAR